MAAAKEFKQTQVTENLKLLAYFVAYVAVVGMKLCEFVGVGVDVGEREFYFLQ